jgi:hypothetical protein
MHALAYQTHRHAAPPLDMATPTLSTVPTAHHGALPSIRLAAAPHAAPSSASIPPHDARQLIRCKVRAGAAGSWAAAANNSPPPRCPPSAHCQAARAGSFPPPPHPVIRASGVSAHCRSYLELAPRKATQQKCSILPAARAGKSSPDLLGSQPPGADRLLELWRATTKARPPCPPICATRARRRLHASLGCQSEAARQQLCAADQAQAQAPCVCPPAPPRAS